MLNACPEFVLCNLLDAIRELRRREKGKDSLMNLLQSLYVVPSQSEIRITTLGIKAFFA
jgi:hypothetical protein